VRVVPVPPWLLIAASSARIYAMCDKFVDSTVHRTINFWSQSFRVKTWRK